MNWTNVTVKLSDLQPWEHNPRQMTKTQAKRLLRSWQELGQFQTIAIGPHGEVYDGHQRLNALLTAYGADYIIEARQCERELNDEERAALSLAANISAGQWDWSKLAAWDAPLLSEWGMNDEILLTWQGDAAALKELLESEEQGSLMEQSHQLKPFRMFRILISVPIDNAIDAMETIDKLKVIAESEIDYGAN
jgi:ParB-like chromosome segregation protein Spo0J